MLTWEAETKAGLGPPSGVPAPATEEPRDVGEGEPVSVSDRVDLRVSFAVGLG